MIGMVIISKLVASHRFLLRNESMCTLLGVGEARFLLTTVPTELNHLLDGTDMARIHKSYWANLDST